MTRVTTGSAKNKQLVSPDIPGFQAIQEVAKLAMFAILEDRVIESTCLDLFAGSGNMGIEALSRGASWCDFVDANKKSIDTIQKNLENCGFQDKAETHKQEAVKFAANTDKTYDIIFLDPFYADTKHKYLMELLPEILNPEGIVIFFHGSNLNMEDLLKKANLHVIDSRKYGKCLVDLLKVKS